MSSRDLRSFDEDVVELRRQFAIFNQDQPFYSVQTNENILNNRIIPLLRMMFNSPIKREQAFEIIDILKSDPKNFKMLIHFCRTYFDYGQSELIYNDFLSRNIETTFESLHAFVQINDRFQRMKQRCEESNQEDRDYDNFSELLRRVLLEGLRERGYSTPVDLRDDIILVLDLIADNPEYLEWVGIIVSIYIQEGCVNQPVRGFMEIAAFAHIAGQETEERMLEAAKYLITLHIVNEYYVLKVPNSQISSVSYEAEIGTTLFKCAYKILQKRGDVTERSWPGVPDAIAYGESSYVLGILKGMGELYPDIFPMVSVGGYDQAAYNIVINHFNEIMGELMVRVFSATPEQIEHILRVNYPDIWSKVKPLTEQQIDSREKNSINYDSARDLFSVAAGYTEFDDDQHLTGEEQETYDRIQGFLETNFDEDKKQEFCLASIRAVESSKEQTLAAVLYDEDFEIQSVSQIVATAVSSVLEDGSSYPGVNNIFETHPKTNLDFTDIKTNVKQKKVHNIGGNGGKVLFHVGDEKKPDDLELQSQFSSDRRDMLSPRNISGITKERGLYDNYVRLVGQAMTDSLEDCGFSGLDIYGQLDLVIASILISITRQGLGNCDPQIVKRDLVMCYDARDSSVVEKAYKSAVKFSASCQRHFKQLGIMSGRVGDPGTGLRLKRIDMRAVPDILCAVFGDRVAEDDIMDSLQVVSDDLGIGEDVLNMKQEDISVGSSDPSVTIRPSEHSLLVGLDNFRY